MFFGILSFMADGFVLYYFSEYIGQFGHVFVLTFPF